MFTDLVSEFSHAILVKINEHEPAYTWCILDGQHEIASDSPTRFMIVMVPPAYHNTTSSIELSKMGSNASASNTSSELRWRSSQSPRRLRSVSFRITHCLTIEQYSVDRGNKESSPSSSEPLSSSSASSSEPLSSACYIQWYENKRMIY